MNHLHRLLQNNREWAAAIRAKQPDFFAELARQQSPEFLWIGCSDSRVPANQIIGLNPGQVFVHRNVANVVVHTDLNCLSVMQYAVDALKVKHILIVGHYGCGGVLAALGNRRLGLIDNWLRHIQDVHLKHFHLLDRTPVDDRHDRLCELNVIEQVVNVCQTTVLRDAWARGQEVCVHGWIYSIADGLVRDLKMTIERPCDLAARYDDAMKALGEESQERPVCAVD
jgi:carbonic anhydrase